MKKIFTILLLGGVMGLAAQTADSVAIGNGYPNKAYYSFANGEISQVPNTGWDLKLAVYSTQTAAIRINGGFGAELYRYEAGDTTAWTSLDTTGLGAGTNWNRCYDSDTSFEPSAFENFATGHPNYGWGVYNNVTHDVVGDKLFVMKTATNSDYKKIWIKLQSAFGQTTTIRVANLDNSGDTTIVISRVVNNKNYVDVNFLLNSVSDWEPSKDTFDLVFERYEANVAPTVHYPVTGITANMGIKQSQASMTHIDDAMTNLYSAHFPTGENMTEIGFDWKTWNGVTFQYDITDSLSYFVEDQNGDIYQIWFTKFDYTLGKYVFNVRQVGWVSVENEAEVVANFNVFPNPTTDILNLTYTLDNDLPNASISIINTNGQIVHSRVVGNNYGFNQELIDVRSMGLCPGVYIVKVQVGNHSNHKRFIVQ